MSGEIVDQDPAGSPSNQDDPSLPGNGSGNGEGVASESKGVKRQRTSTAGADDDDDDDDKPGRERRKIEIKFISDKSRRHITFSKRKAGIMKKAYELSVLTGTQVLLLVVSETGLVYTFTTPKLQPLVTKPEGKNLIQACLNAPEPADANGIDGTDGAVGSPDDTGHQGAPVPTAALPGRSTQMPAQAPYNMSANEAQAMDFQNYLRQHQQQRLQAQLEAYPVPQPNMAQRQQ